MSKKKRTVTKQKAPTQQSSQWTTIAVIAAVALLLALFWFVYNRNNPTTTAPTTAATPVQPNATDPAARNGKYSAPPPVTIDTKKIYFATLKTAKGDIKVQLFADRTPITVNNFVFLAREGFYDNTTFHRVLNDFMAQGGDPTGEGAGGPGYQFADEFGPGLVFDRPGLLAMANTGPNSNGSQFFITFAPTPHLNGRHTIFGEVVAGNEILDQLTRRDPNTNPDFLGDVLTTVVIEESESSTLPTATPAPPTPTPFSPSQLDRSIRPLATLTATERSNYFNTPPTEQVIENKIYTATMLTSQGVLTIELRGDLAPLAVNNFVVLADLGFYDNTPINRVSPLNNLILGSPANNPDSDAGYSFLPEMNLAVKLDLGFIAYLPKTNDPSQASSSQLFITLGEPSPGDGKLYSFFGRVVEGLDILPTLTVSDTVQSITVLR